MIISHLNHDLANHIITIRHICIIQLQISVQYIHKTFSIENHENCAHYV